MKHYIMQHKFELDDHKWHNFDKVIMPLTLEKLKWHIAFGLSVCASVRAPVTKFIKIQF